MYEKLHAEGKLTAPTPSASQIFNLDEKRGTVNPGANAAFMLGRKPCVAHRHRKARPVSSVDTLHRLRRWQSGSYSTNGCVCGRNRWTYARAFCVRPTIKLPCALQCIRLHGQGWLYGTCIKLCETLWCQRFKLCFSLHWRARIPLWCRGSALLGRASRQVCQRSQHQKYREVGLRQSKVVPRAWRCFDVLHAMRFHRKTKIIHLAGKKFLYFDMWDHANIDITFQKWNRKNSNLNHHIIE